jgi:hypothetical protein
MTPEDRALLQNTYKLAEENNELLRKMRRSQRFSRIMTILYWGLIIVISIGSYYAILPYLGFLKGVSSPNDASNVNYGQLLHDLTN